MPAPTKEVWYCWKQFAPVEGCEDEGHRLLTPWGDPSEHEFPFDFIYDSPDKARAGAASMLNVPEDWDFDEFMAEEYPSWVLCRMTLEPIAASAE
jgi:hypothetical protein